MTGPRSAAIGCIGCASARVRFPPVPPDGWAASEDTSTLPTRQPTTPFALVPPAPGARTVTGRDQIAVFGGAYELIMNSWDALSKVAVVSMPRKKLECPSSVIEKQPITRAFSMSS